MPSRTALSNYVERIRSFVLSDRTSFIFNISATMENGQLVLTGDIRAAGIRAESHAACSSNWDSRTSWTASRSFPDLKKDPAPFAVVVKPSVMTWSQPDLKGTPMDEALLGEPVYIFKEFPATGQQPAVYLIKNFSGYWGYAATKGFPPDFQKAIYPTHQCAQSPAAVGLQDEGRFNSRRLPAAGQKLGQRTELCVAGPGREKWEVPKKICERNDRANDAARVVAQARSLLGRPYNLGGRNGLTGIDCSGLVQYGVSHARHQSRPRRQAAIS